MHDREGFLFEVEKDEAMLSNIEQLDPFNESNLLQQQHQATISQPGLGGARRRQMSLSIQPRVKVLTPPAPTFAADLCR